MWITALLLGAVLLVAWLGGDDPQVAHVQAQTSLATPPTPASVAQPITTGPIDAATFRNIAERVTPAVVSVRTESTRPRQDWQDIPDELRQFFDFPGAPNERPRGPAPDPDGDRLEGAGSGFVIDASGLILTNNHVVEGANRIEVGLYSSSQDGAPDPPLREAKVVGRDPLTDTALIRLTALPDTPLTVSTLGSSEAMAPGDWVVAIGNPFNLAHTVTVGVVSAEGRPFANIPGRQQRLLQTDAAINPGNSGGPLLNLRGEVIGINSAIFSTGRQPGNLGIGFAVPIDTVKALLPQLREGKVTRGRIGVQVTAVPPEAAKTLGVEAGRGALASIVERGGPAAEAGMQPGDVVVSFDGKPVESTDQLVQMVVGTAPGHTVPMQVMRAGKPITLNVTVAELEFTNRGKQSADANAGGWGITLSNSDPRQSQSAASGPVVTSVEARSPAARAGVLRGDILLEVNRKAVRDAADALAAFSEAASNQVATLLLSRNGQQVFVTLVKSSQ
jgi:serine protease Do